MKRRFYIDQNQIQNGTARFSGREARHIIKVNRFSPGDILTLVDGKSHLYSAQITRVTQDEVIAEITETISTREGVSSHITLAQGMLKDKKMDTIVRHMTELGISRWIPFFAERSVPRPNPKRLASRMERWERIAREAIKQCGRATLPEISPPLSFQEVMDSCSDCNVKAAFYEKAVRPLDTSEAIAGGPQKIIILIGPEGGFVSSEMDLAQDKGFTLYSMGPRILRAETAALTACSLIQFLFGDLGQNIA